MLLNFNLIPLFLILPCVIALDTNWWKYNNIIYEIYVSSFKDSNGDGVGDIRGIAQQLDHFVDLNIKTLYLSPFYPSPMTDMGYDISNFTDIDPQFGTLADFDEMISEAKKRGLKIMADLVINHSSDEHPWFQKSIDRIKPYANYYMWADAKGYDEDDNPIPPNNWMGIFGGSAWTWNEKRKQFYYHMFNPKQPDFNLRDEDVKKELKDVLKFWFDRGVSGFRMDATLHYIEDKLLRDEPLLKPELKKPKDYGDLDHIYTKDLWETYEFIHELRVFVDNYCKKKNDYERILSSEAYTDLNHTMAYYGTEEYPIIHFPFNFEFVRLPKYFNAKEYQEYLFFWLKHMPKGRIANWVSENHDNKRIGTKFCLEYREIIIFTVMTVPGIACIYYGQEIGMLNHKLRPDQRKDSNIDIWNRYGRDGERLPMQWDDSLNAGFTSNSKPWLPVNPNYWKINVKRERSETPSLYNTFKILSNLRKKNVFKYGTFKSHGISSWVYSFVRAYRSEKYITILNLGTETEILDLHVAIPNISPTLYVVAASLNAGYKPGDAVKTGPHVPKTFTMRPLSVILLTTKNDLRKSRIIANDSSTEDL